MHPMSNEVRFVLGYDKVVHVVDDPSCGSPLSGSNQIRTKCGEWAARVGLDKGKGATCLACLATLEQPS